MSLIRNRKEKLVEVISESFQNNDSFYLLDFTKMSVSQAVTFRKQLRENSHSVIVVKNRLALRALDDSFPDELKNQFRGPTALAFTSTDPVGLAKIIKDFTVQNKVLSVKAAVVEGRFISGDRFSDIANLSSREELIAKFCFVFAYPLRQLLQTMQAPLSSFGRLLDQLKLKKIGLEDKNA